MECSPHLVVVAGDLSLVDGHYRDVLARLSGNGVRISIYYRKQKWIDVDEFRVALERAGVHAQLGALPATASDPVELLGLRLRELGNVLRYAHRDYEGMTVLSERSYDKKSPGVRRWARRLMWFGKRPARIAARLASGLERAVPASRSAAKFIEETAPTAVAAAPVHYVPALVDYLKAAAEQGVATATWVQSWDNLTNKGLLHFTPDRVFVWNKSQEAELARYHGIPAEHVSITGAQTFDHWFTGPPPLDRGAFCERMGLDPERPIILYLASSKQIAPEEPTFFREWLRTVRAGDDDVLRTASIIVRPHPTMLEAWLNSGVEKAPGVALSPSTQHDRLNSEGFREQYRNELHHCAVGFGVNTSGVIDAAIFGKPVCTVELPELFFGQRGTVHFHHLVREECPLLRTSSSLDEHARILAQLVRRDTYARDEWSDTFVAYFIRPHGPDVLPSELFAEEVHKLCRSPSTIRRPGPVRRALQRVVARCSLLLGAPLETYPRQSVLAHLLAALVIAYGKLRQPKGLELPVMRFVRSVRHLYRTMRSIAFVRPAYLNGGHPAHAHNGANGNGGASNADRESLAHVTTRLDQVVEALDVLEARIDLVDGGGRRAYLKNVHSTIKSERASLEAEGDKVPKPRSRLKKDVRAIKKELAQLDRRRRK